MRILLSLSFLLLSLTSALAEGINSSANSDLPIGAGGDVVMLIKGTGSHSGNIGIGNSNPQQKLDVTGNIVASGAVAARGEIYTGNSGATCTAGNPGAIRWTGIIFEGCNGTDWIPLGVGKTSSLCTPGTAGTIQWTGTAFQGCNGTDWVSLGGTIPAGAVMAFNLATCPATWAPLANIEGRAIIGAGQGNTAEGWNWGTVYNVGTRGGFETHTLTVNEMPSHKHNVDRWIASWSDNGNGGVNALAVWNDGDWSGGIASYNNPNIFLGNTGSDQPHNNMMPYMALLYCQKL